MGENKEIWADIPHTGGIYKISSKGAMKRLSHKVLRRNQATSWVQILPERTMKGSIDSHGYRQYSLKMVDGSKRQALAHRLVAKAFLNEPSQELKDECARGGVKDVLVNHIDGNPLNNCVENLEWCTPRHNSQNTRKEYASLSGSLCKTAVLNEEDVDRILILEGKMSQQKIAELFGVKQVTISNIFTGRTWSHYTGKEKRKGSRRKDGSKTRILSER